MLRPFLPCITGCAALLFCTKLSAQFGAHGTFAPDGAQPAYVHVMDVDGDGDTDVLAALLMDNRFGWFANDGTGGFGPMQVLVNDAPLAKWISSGDLDGDGDEDLVIAYGLDATYAWLRNNGGGSYSAPMIIAQEAGQPWALEMADIDQDGDLDLVTSSGSLGLSWHANNGTGTSWSAHVVSSTIAPADLAVGDFDGDGDPDILMACGAQQGTIRWCANMGGGNFAASTLISVGTANGIDVEAVDMDGDGDLDAAYLTTWPHVVGWHANDGNGQFSPAISLNTTTSLPTFLKVDDIDSDGDMDLLVAVRWHQQVIALLNTGNGTFDAPVVVISNAAGANGVAVADMDGDGSRDVVYTSDSDNEVGWAPQTDPGTFGSVQRMLYSIDSPSGVVLADLDGDGDLDPVTGSWTDGGLYWFSNTGDGTMSGLRFIGQGQSTVLPLVPCDADGDGDTDILVASYHGEVGWYANDGAGNFSAQQLINDADTVLRHIIVHDINGDGWPDVVTASQTGPGRIAWYANTAGSFAPAQTVESAIGFLAVDAADLDGDGDADIVGTALPDQLFWYANDGAGNLGGRTTIATNVNQAYEVRAVDVDGDSDMDLVLVRQPVIVFDGGAPVDTLPRAIWYPNDGNGVFGDEREIADFSIGVQMHVVDIDSDGDPDLLFAPGGTIALPSLHLNDGSGSFAPGIPLPTPVSHVNAIRTGDMDGDGDQDVITIDTQLDRIGWYESFFSSPFRIGGRTWLDLDGDGSFSAGDTSASFVRVHTTPVVSQALGNTSGDYLFYLNADAYTVTATTPSNLWALSTPNESYSVQLTAMEPISMNNDFGFAPILDTSLVALSLTSSPVSCNQPFLHWIHARNEGTRVEAMRVRLVIDPLTTVQWATPPADSIIADTAYWTLPPLYYFENGQITCALFRPTGLPGSHQQRDRGIGKRCGNITGTWNSTYTTAFGCAYDPNDKLVQPAGYGIHGAVAIDLDELEYTIRFQNTGTDTALHVVIRDRLSDALDWSSLRVVATSHTLTQAQVEPDGEAVFRFDHILLPDSNVNELASHGFIKFRIGIAPGQAHGCAILNSAAIHFDFAEAVITNITTTTLIDCALFEAAVEEIGTGVLQATPGDHHQWFLNGQAIPDSNNPTLFVSSLGDYEVSVTSEHGCVAMSAPFAVISLGIGQSSSLRIQAAPNPAVTELRLICSEPLKPGDLITLLDMHGRTARTMSAAGGREHRIERGTLANGMYLIQIIRDGASLTGARIVLE
ncbi:MAG: T9SS type A sorting domain-containing protein [Flavobacteriales bacterium]|nr:T9SS type A sorting domain-containing protein [Flavobacteriales bacterium]